MHSVTSPDGTVIAYDRMGDGPAVVLVGGAFTDRRDPVMAALAQHLQHQFTVFNFDRRGRGGSGDTQPYAVAREIDDIGAVIDVAGGKAMVFAGSSGAALALEAAAAGVPITRLVLFEPPYVVDPARPPLPSAHELTELAATGRREAAVELFMIEAADMPAETVSAMREQPFWPAMVAAAHTLAYEAAIVGPGPVPADRFAEVTVPTLVLVGAQSPPRMQQAARAVTDAVPRAQIEILPDQAHGQLDPAYLSGTLMKFFVD